MSSFIKQLVKNKLRQLTRDELLRYGKEYGFTLTKHQAEQIVDYLKKQQHDPFNNQDRQQMLKDLAAITDIDTARKANALLTRMVKEYGLEHLFEN